VRYFIVASNASARRHFNRCILFVSCPVPGTRAAAAAAVVRGLPAPTWQAVEDDVDRRADLPPLVADPSAFSPVTAAAAAAAPDRATDASRPDAVTDVAAAGGGGGAGDVADEVHAVMAPRRWTV